MEGSLIIHLYNWEDCGKELGDSSGLKAPALAARQASKTTASPPVKAGSRWLLAENFTGFYSQLDGIFIT
jgi:hypothetical protein